MEVFLAVKLRLVRFGRKKRPFYRIVAVDSRKKRDGAYIEKVGHYDPLTNPPEVVFDEEKAIKWLDLGAIPTDTVNNLMSKKGILLKRNLKLRNVADDQIEIEMQKWSMIQEEKKSRQKKAAKPAETPAEAEVTPVTEETPEEIFQAEEAKAATEEIPVEEPVEVPKEKPKKKPVEKPPEEPKAAEPEEKAEPEPPKEKKIEKAEAKEPAAKPKKKAKSEKPSGETNQAEPSNPNEGKETGVADNPAQEKSE
jgi:small subunit ribosomal protein S16